jgi:hypothetical protein
MQEWEAGRPLGEEDCWNLAVRRGWFGRQLGGCGQRVFRLFSTCSNKVLYVHTISSNAQKPSVMTVDCTCSDGTPWELTTHTEESKNSVSKPDRKYNLDLL